MAIKAIIFDCFGVLIITGHTILRREHPELITQIDELQIKSDLGKISRHQFNGIIASSIGISPQQVDERYWGTNKYNQPMIDWVHELRQSNKYKIGMLSNINRDWMDVSLPFFDRQNLFDAEVLSGDVSMIKPDPRIFKLMADKLGVETSECVMIDDLVANIAGAKKAGMQGITHVSVEQSRADLDKLMSSIDA